MAATERRVAVAQRERVAGLAAWDPEGTIQLLTEIVRGAPSLPGAACRGRYELFDTVPGRDPERHAQQRQRLELAAELCRGCPARPGCPAALLQLHGRFLTDHC